MEMFRLLIGLDDGSASALQLCVRALLLFIFGILCIRVAGRRTFSQASPLDIIVAIVVGSNISRLVTGKAPFMPDLSATFALVVLHRVIAKASLRWPALGHWVKCNPVPLILDGVIDEKGMKEQNLSHGDLLEALRLERIEDPADIAIATLEGGGRISIVPKDKVS